MTIRLYLFTTRNLVFCDTYFVTLASKLPQSTPLRRFLRPLSLTAVGF